MKSARAKVFRTGGSQAVRLPKDFRVRGKEVLVRRIGDAIILEPIGRGRGWSAEFIALVEGPPDVVIERHDAGPYEREDIDLE
jgi:antitoxin VapB